MVGMTAVNRPVDVKQKERDISNKLQLYGILTAFSNGKVPSNKQIDVALNSTLASRPLSNPSNKLSPEGRKLVGDLRDVVEKAKILLLTKNDGNLLQEFIWHSQHISGGAATAPGATVDKGTAKEHGNQALDGLRTLGTLIVSNGQFRKLLNDATILMRDIAGDAAQNAANRINPSSDELSQIDRPADDNTWHDVPDMSRDNIKNQVRGKYNEQKPTDRDGLRQVVGDATQAAHPAGSRDPHDAAQTAARDQRYGTSSGMDAGSGVRAGIDSLKHKAEHNMPEETKERGRERRDKAFDYFGNKMPKERREQTIWRLKKMILEIQGHQDYQRAIDTLLYLAEQYTGHTKNMAHQTTGTVKGAHTDPSLTAAEMNIKTLIERFANNTSLDDLFDAINQIYRDADQDKDLKYWFRDMNMFVRRLLKEEGYVMDNDSTHKWNELYDRGHSLLRDRYRGHTDHIADEFKYLAHQFDEDPLNRSFADSLNRLFHELGNDQNGKPTFKPHLLKDLTDVIIPGIFESVRYIPVPRIEYSDPQFDAVIENLVIESDNFAPNMLEFASDNYFRWGRRTATSGNKNKVMFSMSGVQMDLRDVSYYIKRKQGFPKVTDIGIADIYLGGTGFSFKIAMETADKTDRAHFFKISSVDVDIKNLDVRLKQSKHKMLFNIAKPILFGVIKPVITKVLEKQIRNYAQQIDGLLYSVHQEAKSAEGDLRRNPNRENANNIYQRYVNGFNKRMMQGKQKSKEKAADKKVNVAVTQHDSIFKDIALPGGISTKATEYRDLAYKGDRWESPVFSIGSSSGTNNWSKLPAAARRTRNSGPDRSVDYNRTTANGNTTGFQTQVNQAFSDGNANSYKLAQPGVTTVTTVSGANGLPLAAGQGATLLGANNPVLRGAA